MVASHLTTGARHWWLAGQGRLVLRQENSTGFDVIGDVHGHVEKLVELLTRMGYGKESGVWPHPSRQAAFVGDLIDRGPKQLEVLRLVRPMIDSGSALIVAGNHEFNAIAYHTPDAAKSRDISTTTFRQEPIAASGVSRCRGLSAGGVVWLRSGCGGDSPTGMHWCVSGSAIWNNNGGTVFLLDPSGNVVDSVGY